MKPVRFLSSFTSLLVFVVQPHTLQDEILVLLQTPTDF